MNSRDDNRTQEGAGVSVLLEVEDHGFWKSSWLCEKWSQEAVEFCQRKLEERGIQEIQDGVDFLHTGEKTWDNNLQMEVEKLVVIPRLIPVRHGITSEVLRNLVGEPEESLEIAGNLLLNEGIQRLLDLLIGAGGAAFNNAGTYIGVGDTATAEAATQTELLAAANAANRFYKVMVATYPIRTNQTMDFRSDFTSTEANFIWNEWTVAAGATTASGAGFLTGTTNLNRKVQSLGTKTTGTWTLTGSVTIS